MGLFCGARWRTTHEKYATFVFAIMLGMNFWLLHEANSSTSLICTLFGHDLDMGDACLSLKQNSWRDVGVLYMRRSPFIRLFAGHV